MNNTETTAIAFEMLKIAAMQSRFANIDPTLLAQFRQGTASDFDPNSWLDRNKMHRLMQNESGWSDNAQARRMGSRYDFSGTPVGSGRAVASPSGSTTVSVGQPPAAPQPVGSGAVLPSSNGSARVVVGQKPAAPTGNTVARVGQTQQNPTIGSGNMSGTRVRVSR